MKQKLTVCLSLSFLFLVSCHELIAQQYEQEKKDQQVGYLPSRSIEYVREIENKNRGYDIQIEGISVFDY
ncbi:MAG: hypothetical protein HRU38_20475 [Saccharospirillaceae bacterium]|nr:hypothetical protein [Pseudomonadales bacterium]NRB81009.1 hypothetical protein [Saccharospirillaceae bacterium]